MELLVTLVRVFAVLNIALLVGLTYVWGRNYAQLRSKHALGLLLFAVFLLGENLFAVYFFVLHDTLSAWIADETLVPPIAAGAMLVLRVFEFLGLAVISWVTWD